jgi:integrase
MYGRRRGEIAGLRWYNVDLKAKTVVIVENRVANGKQILTGTPKSKASNRMLPMPEEVVAILKARACDSQRSGRHSARDTGLASTSRPTSRSAVSP